MTMASSHVVNSRDLALCVPSLFVSVMVSLPSSVVPGFVASGGPVFFVGLVIVYLTTSLRKAKSDLSKDAAFLTISCGFAAALELVEVSNAIGFRPVLGAAGSLGLGASGYLWRSRLRPLVIFTALIVLLRAIRGEWQW